MDDLAAFEADLEILVAVVENPDLNAGSVQTLSTLLECVDATYQRLRLKDVVE